MFIKMLTLRFMKDDKLYTYVKLPTTGLREMSEFFYH